MKPVITNITGNAVTMYCTDITKFTRKTHHIIIICVVLTNDKNGIIFNVGLKTVIKYKNNSHEKRNTYSIDW